MRIAFATLLVVAFVLVALAVLAQQPAPFAPITIDETAFKNIKGYIDTNLPTGLGRPLAEELDRLEAVAREKAKAEAAAKAKAPVDPATK